MLDFLREGKRHRPGGAWLFLIRAGSVAAALYVLWIGALAQVFGTWALDLGSWLGWSALGAFGIWARAATSYFHFDISIFIAITFPIAFLTTTANPRRATLAHAQTAGAKRRGQLCGDCLKHQRFTG